jgi:hypothetical protein
VDWITDPKFDRTKVNTSTAAHLRVRMRQCKMLVYVHSENSTLSKWCPWELGYFDGLRGGNVFIFPVARESKYGFAGQEYLGLYPYLTQASDSGKVLLREANDYGYIEAARTRVFRRA